MAKHSRLRAWKWTALLLGTLWVSIGCTPATLTYFLMPFSDDRIPAKCPLPAAGKKEVTVCIVTEFAALETSPETAPAERELAELFAQQLRKRCQENKEKVKVIPPEKVRSYKRQSDLATRSNHDIGKHFKADYVITLEINQLAIYEKGSSRSLFRGNTEINIQVVDVNKPLGEGTIFTEPYHREFPTNGPRDVSDVSATQFRGGFLNVVASELARMFTPYPKDQRFVID
jgi:hypothetical protein